MPKHYKRIPKLLEFQTFHVPRIHVLEIWLYIHFTFWTKDEWKKWKRVGKNFTTILIPVLRTRGLRAVKFSFIFVRSRSKGKISCVKATLDSVRRGNDVLGLLSWVIFSPPVNNFYTRNLTPIKKKRQGSFL